MPPRTCGAVYIITVPPHGRRTRRHCTARLTEIDTAHGSYYVCLECDRAPVVHPDVTA